MLLFYPYMKSILAGFVKFSDFNFNLLYLFEACMMSYSSLFIHYLYQDLFSPPPTILKSLFRNIMKSKSRRCIKVDEK